MFCIFNIYAVEGAVRVNFSIKKGWQRVTCITKGIHGKQVNNGTVEHGLRPTQISLRVFQLNMHEPVLIHAELYRVTQSSLYKSWIKPSLPHCLLVLLTSESDASSMEEHKRVLDRNVMSQQHNS